MQRLSSLAWRAGGLAALGCALLLALPARAQYIQVTPEPVGFARQFLGTRGDTEPALPDLTDPAEDGLVIAEPGASLEVRPRALSGIQATTTYQLMQASQISSPAQSAQLTQAGRLSLAPTYLPVATQTTYAGITTMPIDPTPTGTTGTTGGGVLPPSPPLDPYAEQMAKMERLQAIERRNQIEREQQARVFQMLQANVEEISALRKEREKAQLERVEAMRDVRGPSALAAINLFEGLYVDRGVPLAQSEILAIDQHVYQDANPETGLFYYAPKRYDLQWDPENQYAMTVIYGMAGAGADEGEVYMATRLRAGVDFAELRLVEDLLLAYLRRNAGDGPMRFRELRPLPLATSSDVELFGGANNQFTVPPDKISVQGITGLLDSMDVSWATDVRRLLNVESLLRTDANIHGSITMHASGEESLSRTIPLEIAVASGDTFGRIPFDRANGWQNRTRYPVRLESLHALLLAPKDGNGIRQDQPIVVTWNLHDVIVPPGAQIVWNDSAVPAWLESASKKIWVKYGVDGSCEPCDDMVFTERFIPPPPSTRQIVFTTGDAFESTGAHQIRVHVRSPFLDPQRTRVLMSPSVLLQQDGAEVPIARLFLTDREMYGVGAEEPFYEFRIEVVMRDGQVFQSGWQPSRTLDYLLGSASIRQALGHLPGEDPGEEGPAS